jgi:hypothetical protein
MASEAHARVMRAALLMLAMLIFAAAPGAFALQPWMCIPESIVCAPQTALCPGLGGTLGYCITPVAEDADGDGQPDVVGADARAGNHAGPAVHAWAIEDAQQGPFANVDVLLLCDVSVVLPIVGEPPVPCTFDLADEVADL